MSDSSPDPRRDHHHTVVATASADFHALTEAANGVGSSVKSWVRLGLAMQCTSLAALEQELRTALPGRRVWSMGQASMPVLRSLVNAVEKRGGVDQVLIQRCRRSLEQLGVTLTALAEGR